MTTPTWPLWEVFIRSKQGLDHKHVGSLHAADAEMEGAGRTEKGFTGMAGEGGTYKQRDRAGDRAAGDDKAAVR